MDNFPVNIKQEQLIQINLRVKYKKFGSVFKFIKVYTLKMNKFKIGGKILTLTCLKKL